MDAQLRLKRMTRTKATHKATRKTHAGDEEKTPTVRQRIAEARRSFVLDLRSLGLKNLPVDAEKIAGLQALLLGGNELSSFPSNLEEIFPRLVYLDLSDNDIASIPSSISELEELQLLDVEENPKISGKIPSALKVLVEEGRLTIMTEKPDPDTIADALTGRSDIDDDNRSIRSDTPYEDYNPDEDSYSDYSDEAQANEKGKAWRDEYYATDEEDEDDEASDQHWQKFSNLPSHLTQRGNLDTRSATSSQSSDASSLSSAKFKMEFALFMARFPECDPTGDRISEFQQSWATSDNCFVRYISKRYAAESGRARKNGVRVVARLNALSLNDEELDDNKSDRKPRRTKDERKILEGARKDKERYNKNTVREGRKIKSSVQDLH